MRCVRNIAKEKSLYCIMYWSMQEANTAESYRLPNNSLPDLQCTGNEGLFTMSHNEPHWVSGVWHYSTLAFGCIEPFSLCRNANITEHVVLRMSDICMRQWKYVGGLHAWPHMYLVPKAPSQWHLLSSISCAVSTYGTWHKLLTFLCGIAE